MKKKEPEKNNQVKVVSSIKSQTTKSDETKSDEESSEQNVTKK